MQDAHQISPKVSGGRLGQLPVVMYYLRRLRVQEIIDEMVPPHGQHIVTHGECILALLCTIFYGKHTLSQVTATLNGFDLEYLFDKPGLTSDLFNDTRLGEALDALYGITEKLYAEIALRGIQEFQIPVRRIHTDTTTVKLQGEYDSFPETEASKIKTPPLPANGKSKDFRPDLKQLLFSLSVTDSAIPVYGRVTDGNTSDVEEFRHHIEKLAAMLEDLRELILVADCKLCTEPTLRLAHELGFNLVTLVPDNYLIRKELIQKASQETDLPLLLRTREGEEYHGRSYKTTTAETDSNGETYFDTRRYLVIHSSQLEIQRRLTRQRGIEKEKKVLEKLISKMGKMVFACSPDAETVAQKTIAETKSQYHQKVCRQEVFRHWTSA